MIRIRSLQPPNAEQLSTLLRIASGRAMADLFFEKVLIADVYTGEVRRTNVAIWGPFIGYVGPSKDMVGRDTEVIPMGDSEWVLTPGWIEPHAHPFVGYNAVRFFEKIASLGTTTVIADTLFFVQATQKPETFPELLEKFTSLPINIGWGIRLGSQSLGFQEEEIFSPERILQALRLPDVVQIAEITNWPRLLNDDPKYVHSISAAREAGLRVDGHNAGLSLEKLQAAAAVGETACHEAIRSQEVLERLRAGLWVMLRQSSLRKDLPALLEDLPETALASGRFMLTTDGAAPYYLQDGFINQALRVAVSSGLQPMTALRMATLWPATYYHLDDMVGGIAPGKYADLVLIDNLTNFNPQIVWYHGKKIAEDKQALFPSYDLDWDRFGLGRISCSESPIDAEWMVPICTNPSFPVVDLVGTVITRASDEVLPCDGAGHVQLPDDSTDYVALLDRQHRWVVNGVLQGMFKDIEALATSATIAMHLLAIGRSPHRMADALQRVQQMGGGIVVIAEGRLQWEIPLPVGGICSEESVDNLVYIFTNFQRWIQQKGYRFDDILYTLEFLTFDTLPSVKWTPLGLWDAKGKTLIYPARLLST
ncbi:MAG: adenine deaminase [Firmicutes bacterium]|nr:adenine deaminase [Bacillota bacterium]